MAWNIFKGNLILLMLIVLLVMPNCQRVVNAAASLSANNHVADVVPSIASTTSTTTATASAVEQPAAVTGSSNGANKCDMQTLEMSLLCRGARAMRNAIHNLSKVDQPIVIVRGLEIVPVSNEVNEAETDDSLLGRLASYLRTHELNVKFSDLLATSMTMYDTTSSPLARADNLNGGGAVIEGRKKDKGQGIVLAMAMMMAKMMAMLGLGGIGALAMKALGVAMMALVISGLVGLKSLSQQGHDSGHSVSYVSGDGHHHKRRRRHLAADHEVAVPLVAPQLAYRGYWLRPTNT